MAPSGAERGRSLALVWAGTVLGVSFLATPAKFLTPSLPLPVALDVGRHTFRIFGYVEMVFAALLCLRVTGSSRQHRFAVAPGLVVLLQALWLRPQLHPRTQQVVKGEVAPRSSNLHLAYVACEAAKLGALLTLGSMTARSADRESSRMSSDLRPRRMDQQG